MVTLKNFNGLMIPMVELPPRDENGINIQGIIRQTCKLLPSYRVCYWDNDGQSVTMKTGLTFHSSVKYWQRCNDAYIPGCYYEAE